MHLKSSTIVLGYLFFIFMIFCSVAVYAEDATCPDGYVCTKNETDSTVSSESNSTTKVESPPPSALTCVQLEYRVLSKPRSLECRLVRR